MLLLAIAAFAFGLLAARGFTAAPFVAGNVLAAVAVVVFGLANGWSLGRVLEGLVVTVVCLQAGFLFGMMRKAVGGRRERMSSDAEKGRPGLRSDPSTMDRTH